MRKDFLIFGSPKIEQEEIDEVVDSLKSGWISTGPKVAKFEALFKQPLKGLTWFLSLAD